MTDTAGRISTKPILALEFTFKPTTKKGSSRQYFGKIFLNEQFKTLLTVVMDEQTYILLNAILTGSQGDGFTGSNREPDNELYALCNEFPCLSWDFFSAKKHHAGQ